MHGGSLGIWFEVSPVLRIRGSRTCMALSVGEKQPNCGSIFLSSFVFLSSSKLLSCVCVCVCVHAQKSESWWIPSLNLVRGGKGALTILSLHSGLQFGLEVCRKQWIGL